LLAAGGLVAILATLTLLRSSDFRSADALFRDAAAKQPRSFFAQYFLAQELYLLSRAHPPNEHELLVAAAEHMRLSHQAVDLERNNRVALALLLEGTILARLGDPEARGLLREALRRAPRGDLVMQVGGREQLAEICRLVWLRTHDPASLQEMVECLTWLVERKPKEPSYRIRLAEGLEKLGRTDAARFHYQELRADRDYRDRAEKGLSRLALPGGS
jgi:hypothetical protein